MSGTGVTFVIPTYNGASRIRDPLRALLEQQVEPHRFEVVVVDNNSKDGTAQVVEASPEVAGLRGRGIEVRVEHEPRQGLLFARLLGIQAARRELVCFLDDDNVPESNFATDGLALFEDPKVGVVISRLYPRYEVEPPPSIARREHLLAINHRMGDAVVDFGTQPTLAPTIGAGLWLRRAAFLESVPWQTPEQLMPDRLGTQLLSGGDIEFGYLLGKAGHERRYGPTLKVWHIIRRSRLETRYFLRLIVGVVRWPGRASALTSSEAGPGAPRRWRRTARPAPPPAPGAGARGRRCAGAWPRGCGPRSRARVACPVPRRG
jgi:glycosyltransferase involved in cell wall biosynthesis